MQCSAFDLYKTCYLTLMMPSFSKIALGLAPAAFLFVQNAAAGHSDYCLDYPLSCSNTTAQNTCCFNYPGGELLQTQFWDTDPATGPPNHWTVHGLWYGSFIPVASNLN